MIKEKYCTKFVLYGKIFTIVMVSYIGCLQLVLFCNFFGLIIYLIANGQVREINPYL